jgi:hypothetical protein
MDKIEIIDLDEEEEDEEEEDELEENIEEEESLEEHIELMKKKTDREVLESIALKLISLEQTVKKIQDDLVDTYNLIIESEAEDDEN